MPEDEWFGIRLSLSRLAATQYAHWNFNSMCKFNGICLGANSDGIYKLFESDSDDGTPINAAVEFPAIDLQMARIRVIHIGYETSGRLRVGFQADDQERHYYILEPRKLELRSHTNKLFVGRAIRGRYWTIILENILGSDFSLDSIDLYPVPLIRRQSSK